MTDDFDDTNAATASELMAEGAARLIAGVEAGGAEWVVQRVTRIVDLWGGLDAATRTATIAAARAEGGRAATRVAGELRALCALDPRLQRVTPLEVVRSLRREATAVLAGAGVPPIVRDPFDERAFPDDVYGIVPLSVAELARDESTQAELGGALLAWGLGKARALRELPDIPPEG